MKQTLAALAVLAGIGTPLYGQSATAVEVVCAKGQGIYKPICGQVKKAVKKNPLFKPSKKGNRYVVLVYAETGYIGGGGVDMSVSYGAVTSDALSQVFPYHIASIPWVFTPSQSKELAQGIIDGGLLAAALVFEALAEEINSYGASTTPFDEAAVQERESRIKLAIERALKE